MQLLIPARDTCFWPKVINYSCIRTQLEESFCWYWDYYPGALALNTLRPRLKGRHFPDDIFKWIFLNENVWISIYISLKFVPRGPINNIPALLQIMAWRRPGDKTLSEPMMVRLPTHMCVTLPEWVKSNHCNSFEDGALFMVLQRLDNMTRYQDCSLSKACPTTYPIRW